MPTVNKLDYQYKKLMEKVNEHMNDTIEISDYEYIKYYGDIVPDKPDNPVNPDTPVNPNEDNEHYNFMCQEWRDKSVGASPYIGPVNIVEDPLNSSNHCIKIEVRSEEDAITAQNIIGIDNNHLADWDTQFYIYSEKAIATGSDIKLIIDIRASVNGISIRTQSHNAPEDYNYWQCLGNFEFTQEWKHYEMMTTVSTDMTQEANGKEFHTISFNLSNYKNGYIAYFDNIQLYVKEPNKDNYELWIDDNFENNE